MVHTPFQQVLKLFSQGTEYMGGTIMAGLNMDKINNRIVKSVTPEEALDKIDPIT